MVSPAKILEGSHIFRPPESIDLLVGQFAEVTEIKTGESLAQQGQTRLFSVNYFARPVIEPLLADAQRERRISERLNRAFDPVKMSTSRDGLVMLLENLVDLAKRVEDTNDGLDIFYTFNGKIGKKVNTVVKRAAREAHGIAGWRKTPVFHRDLALANKMSDLYAFVSIFGGIYKDLPFCIFDQIINAYVGAVRGAMVEAGQSGNGNPTYLYQNSIIASRFIFGVDKTRHFDTRVTFRGANLAKVDASYRKDI